MSEHNASEEGVPEVEEKDLDPFEGEPRDRSLLRDLCEWVANSKQWWLIPILLGLALVGLLVGLGGSVFAPFIYPLF